MGFLDKLQFWKKNDEFDFGSSNSFGGSSDPFGSDPFGSSSQSNNQGMNSDPFATQTSSQSSDPFGGNSDPFGSSSQDPFVTPSSQQNQQHSQSSNFGNDPFGAPTNDGFAQSQQQSHTDSFLASQDSYGSAGTVPNPFSSHTNTGRINQNIQNNQNDFSQHSNQPQKSVGQQMAHEYIHGKSDDIIEKGHSPLEVINLKLDAIRGSLDNLDLRMRRLEANFEKEKKYW
jgi:hypothetical protein